MRGPITYAELLLILILAPLLWIGGTHLYEFVTDRITVECNFKKYMGGSKPSARTVIMPAETNPKQFQSVIPERICDDIVCYGKEQNKQMALTGNSNKDNKKLTKLELKNIQKNASQILFG